MHKGLAKNEFEINKSSSYGARLRNIFSILCRHFLGIASMWFVSSTSQKLFMYETGPQNKQEWGPLPYALFLDTLF